jgi:EmrB/QacA subfamily drug resistance transporter
VRRIAVLDPASGRTGARDVASGSAREMASHRQEGRAVPTHKWWTLTIVCIGIFMLLLDITIVNIALPDLVKSLHASFTDLEWVIDAYAISLAALLLIAGSLGDLAGARKVFMVGLAVFCVSSLMCGISQTPGFLIAFRAVQGIGGAAMFATSLALLAHEFRGRDRGIALSAWGATAGAAVAVGPLIGGALTTGISWRWIFLINVPIGVVAFFAAMFRVCEVPSRPGVRPDWPGFVTLAGAMLAGVYGLIRGNQDGWASPGILAAFCACAVLLAAFLLIEHVKRDRQPMLELSLFRNPALTGACLAALTISATIFSVLLYLTLYLQDVLRFSAFGTGLRFLPLTVPIILVAPLAGRLSAFVPQRFLIGGGLALIAVGLALMTMVSATSGWTVLISGMIVSGVGSGMVNPPLASAAVGTVSREKAGVGSGINNTFRQVGIAIGIAGLGAIFSSTVTSAFASSIASKAPGLARSASRITSSVTSGSAYGGAHARGPVAHAVAFALQSAFVTGLDRICWIAAIVAACGAVLSAVLLRTRSISSAPEASEEHLEAMSRAA